MVELEIKEPDKTDYGKRGALSMKSKINIHFLAKISVAVMAILLAGAAYFYKERILFVDSAFTCFNIINNHSFLIPEYRYAAFISQITPIVCAFLHLSLKKTIFLYSISFNLFYIATACLLVYKYRKYELAILLAFYFTAFVSDGFFWPYNEVQQGICWMFLCLGSSLWLAEHNKKRAAVYVVFIVLSFLAVFSHFLTIIPFAFLWFYLWLEKKHWHFSPPTSVLFSIIWISFFLLKFKLGLKGWYDGDRLKNATHFNLKDLTNAIRGPHAIDFSHYILTNYWIILLVFVTGLIGLIVDKKYLLFSLTIAFTFGYFLAVCLTFGAFGRNMLFYMESEWMGLGIVMATPFVYSVLPKMKPAISLWALVIIFSTRLVFIGVSSSYFSERITFIENIESKMREKNISKLVLKRDWHTDNALVMDWGVPVESLFISAMRYDSPQLSFTVLPDENLKRVPTDNRTFVSCFTEIKPEEINLTYFHPDTMRSYIVMSYDELFEK